MRYLVLLRIIFYFWPFFSGPFGDYLDYFF